MTRAMIRIRNSRALRIATAAAACTLLQNSSMAKEVDCPSFAEPKANLQWVAPYMIFNGVPMSIKRFDSEQTPADILAFYRQAWNSATPSAAPQEYMSGPWQTIASMRGKCFFTVQVQAAGKNGSTGLLSATEVQNKPRVSVSALPMMSGSTVLNDIDHADEGKNARTLLISNGFSAEANADFYRQQLSDIGWKVISSSHIASKKGPGITLIMKRGTAEASLVITSKGGDTAVLANMVENP
jgi:hypothetical protein